MRRLSGTDSFFLTSEGPSWPMHVCGLAIVDAGNAPGFTADRLRAVIEERLPRIPEFMCKLKTVPLGLDRPLWVHDDEFSLDNHFRRMPAPHPGGPRQLGDFVGEIMSLPLDRRRPLWELWYIEGLERGRVALLTKTHHSLVDGVSGAGLAEVLCDLEPNPEPAEVAVPDVELERVPSDVELTVRGLGHTLLTPLRVGRFGVQLAQQGVELLRFSRRKERPHSPLSFAPATPFNRPLSQLRSFAFVSVPLDDVKLLRKQHDVKINDIVLALTSSALRSYLQDIDALPAESLIASVPLSTRTEEHAGELGNRIANMMVPLATDIDDPLERLRTIFRFTTGAKEMTTALQAKKIMSLSDTTPPGVANLAWRFIATNAESSNMLPSNLIVSNIPGPPIPIYSAGARIESIIPVSALLVGMGLNITVMSYIDKIDFGFVADRVLIPDLWALAEGVPRALQELRDATDAPVSAPNGQAATT